MLLLTGCAKRVVVDESGQVQNGWRVDMLLGLSQLASAQVDLANAVDALEGGGELGAERAQAIRTLNGDVAQVGRELNTTLAQSPLDVAVLPLVTQLRDNVGALSALLPAGLSDAVTAALTIVLEAADQLQGESAYGFRENLPYCGALAA